MSKEGSPKQEPADDSIEAQVSAAIDSANEVETKEADDENEKQSTESEPKPEDGDTDDGDDGNDGADDGEDGAKADEVDTDTESTDEDAAEDSSDNADEADDNLGDGESEKPLLEAPEHWAERDRELFNDQSKEAKEWLLERHKSMEGDYTRKSQEFASDKRQYDAITDALSPYTAEFQQAGLDNAGAVRQLAGWHNALRTGGKAAILQLAETYKIDLSETDDLDIDPTVKTLQNEVSQLRADSTRQVQAAQQDKQKQLYDVIQAFESEKDESGKLKNPHFNTLRDDITRLFQSGIAADLPDAYNKALTFRSDLTVLKEPKVTEEKPDQAEKVKKAKKAATGVKSSGATSKRRDMTLEEEIASQIN